MRSKFGVCLLLFCLGIGVDAEAAGSRIVKVLPHFLDQQGRHTLSPSLYERDAYQAHLRRNPEERSALRFDVQWKSKNWKKLRLRLELRGRKGDESTTAMLDQGKRQRGLFSYWTALTLTGDRYKKFGELTAWRATLLDGDQVVAEQKSFLW